MRIVRLSMRNFRSYAAADVELGPGVTVVTGRNGAGKTNLLDALYFGCTGRSARTTNERELVRFGEQVVRVEVTTEAPDGPHELSVGFTPGEPKRMMADGVRVERLLDVPGRPLVSVFLPDRLELIKGRPRCGARTWTSSWRRCGLRAWRRAARTTRRSRSATRSSRAIRAGGAAVDSLSAWDRELARHGIALMADRAAAIEAVAEHFAARAEELGLDGDPSRRATGRARRPRTPTRSRPSWRSARAQDVERGFTGHGPAPRRPAPAAARDASCAPTARRASSASACWRCCWPSARRSPRRARRRR